jgi:heptosyltransferase II
MKILIELPSWLGDAIMTTPAIENISNHLDSPEITLIGPFAVTEILKNNPIVSKVVVLEKNYFNIIRYARSLGHFDIYFSFRGTFRAKVLSLLVFSKRKYQFDKRKYLKTHQVEKYNNFINESLDANYSAGPLKLNFKAIDKDKKNNQLGINPGASYGNSKRWYPENFAQVAVSLSDRFNIIIFGGPSEEDIAKDIEKRLIQNGVFNYVNLAGKTNISELALKISSLDLLITGDSGPMHIAAAFQVPTVAIFGPTNDQETSQWMNKNSSIVKTDLDCQPCMRRLCHLKHHNCMKMVHSIDVINASNLIV